MSCLYNISATVRHLLLIFFIAFAIRAAFPDTSYFFWDESVYLLHGKLLAGQAVGYSEAFLRPPLLPMLLAPLAWLGFGLGFGFYELAARLLLAFLNALVVFPVFFLASFLFNKRSAFIAAAIAALLPIHILNSRWVMSDSLGALLAFSSVAAFFIGLQRKKRFLICFGGALAGLAVLMKFTNLLLFPLLLPLVVAYRRQLASIARSAIAFAAVLAPYLAWSGFAFGNPFYAFGRAFHVVAESDSSGAGFFAFLVADAFGALMVFLALGMAVSLKQRHFREKLYLAYCVAVSALYSFFIVARGVSKQAGIEWEAERFLLLLALFALPFIGSGVAFFANSLLAAVGRYLHGSFLSRAGGFSFGFAAAIIVLMALLPMQAQFARAYASAISFEDGLRSVSKDIGMRVRSADIESFACIGNCPPVAYYSGKKMLVYYSISAIAAANHARIVVFDSGLDAFPNYNLSESFCSGSHCAYLLQRQ